MGPTRFELVTSSLSGTRSNQLSYEPVRTAPPIGFCSRRGASKRQAKDCKASAGGVNRHPSLIGAAAAAGTTGAILTGASLKEHRLYDPKRRPPDLADA